MPAPRKTQGLVLPYHTVSQNNVAAEAMRDPGIHGKQIGRESQHVYLEMARSAGMPVGDWLLQKKHPLAAFAFNHLARLHAGEEQAGA